MEIHKEKKKGKQRKEHNFWKANQELVAKHINSKPSQLWKEKYKLVGSIDGRNLCQSWWTQIVIPEILIFLNTFTTTFYMEHSLAIVVHKGTFVNLSSRNSQQG